MAGHPEQPVFRATAVLTACDGEQHYFTAPAEVPASLRQEMDRALNGPLTATIVLADEAGQRYLRQRKAAAAKPAAKTAAPPALALRRFILEATAAALFAAAVWVLAALR